MMDEDFRGLNAGLGVQGIEFDVFVPKGVLALFIVTQALCLTSFF